MIRMEPMSVRLGMLSRAGSRAARRRRARGEARVQVKRLAYRRGEGVTTPCDGQIVAPRRLFSGADLNPRLATPCHRPVEAPAPRPASAAICLASKTGDTGLRRRVNRSFLA